MRRAPPPMARTARESSCEQRPCEATDLVVGVVVSGCPYVPTHVDAHRGCFALAAGQRVQGVATIPRDRIVPERRRERVDLTLVTQMVEQHEAAAPDLRVVVLEGASTQEIERHLSAVTQLREPAARCRD